MNGLRFLYALVPFFVRRFLYAAANASIIGVTGSSLSGLDRYSNRMPFSRNFRSNLMKEEVSRLIREVSRVRIVSSFCRKCAAAHSGLLDYCESPLFSVKKRRD